KSKQTARKSSKSGSKKTEGDSPDDLVRPTTPPGKKSPQNKSDESGGGGSAWPCFLGPDRDNRSQDTGLLKEWPQEGPPLAWSTQGLGQGYASVSVAKGLVFTMGTPDGQESVLAVDLATGTPKWNVTTGAEVYRDEQGNGPRSTPTIDG